MISMEAFSDKDVVLMKAWDDNIASAYGVLNDGLYSLAVYKGLHGRFATGCFEPFSRGFWVSVSDNAIQMAAVQWCKVFGSENNEIRYDKLVNEIRFIAILGTEIPFKKVSDEIRHFRNKYVAHSANFNAPVPVFDNALKVVKAFDEVVREEYDAEGLMSLIGAYDAYRMQVTDYFDALGIKGV